MKNDEALDADLLGALRDAFPEPARPSGLRVAYWDEVDSPIGTLHVATGEDGRVRQISFWRGEAGFVDDLLHAGWVPVKDRRHNDPLERQLDEFFEGRRQQFDVAVDLSSVNPFTRSVLETTARIPFGGTDTYSGIAAKIGSPRAARAVGNALGANPVPIVVPCHRILAAGGRIGGYARGLAHGLDIKRRLLGVEGVTIGL
jgi:methylated-DNA-[protein]-cysteine S-methyltransferase